MSDDDDDDDGDDNLALMGRRKRKVPGDQRTTICSRLIINANW